MELLLKIGDDPQPDRYRDGDIVSAFSTDHIMIVNAETIIRRLSRLHDTSGLNDSGSLLEEFSELSSEYRFDRSNQSVTRTNLITGEVTIHDRKTEESINVDQFLRRRLRRPDHKIFGTSGGEYWFGGSRDFTSSELWDLVENHSDNIRSDFQSWPLSTTERSHFLPISCAGYNGNESDISTPTAHERTNPVLEESESLSPEILARREWFVPYWDLNQTLSIDLDDVRDSEKVVDIRSTEGSPQLDSLNVSKVTSGLI